MAWIKIPAEHHPIFLAAVPKDRRSSTMKMFGGLAGLVNGNMYGGLFARSIIVKLSAADQKAALELDGAEPFDPMGNGRLMKDTILLPETVMDDPKEVADWLRRAFDYTATLPAKKTASATVARPAKPKPKSKKPAKKPAARPKPKTKPKKPRPKTKRSK